MNSYFVNTRSSIKLTGTKTIYFDPLEIDGQPHDADFVFVTHEHYDHFSPVDIGKVLAPHGLIIVPQSMLGAIEPHFDAQRIRTMLPGQTQVFDTVSCTAVPAYNIGKPFHKKESGWVGYVVGLDGRTYYAMGDTDATPEAAAVDADVIFIPVGGKYTMDAHEAAQFINAKPHGIVVPIHFEAPGSGELFVSLLAPGTQVGKFRHE